MQVIFTPKIKYKPNLGILVPPFYPNNLLSYFCWFSFAKYNPNIKPVFVVLGNSKFDVIPWARRLNYKIINTTKEFNPDFVQEIIDWQKLYAVTVCNMLCLRKINFNQDFFSDYFFLNGTKPSNIIVCDKFFQQAGDICHISDIDARDIAFRIVHNKEIFDSLDNCNKIRISRLIKQSLAFRPLIEKELCHETIQL